MAEAPKAISYLPTKGLSYDPSEAVYWDADALDGEVTRVFEVCHGCRLCFKYCDAFPSLFKLIDERYDGDVRRLDAAERERVLDLCFQCKLCEVQCPYSPSDGHEFQLDFPRLVHRQRAQRVRRSGVSLQDRFFGDPDGAARKARASLGLVNRMNELPAFRWLMEKLLGIHREKLLPTFARVPFDRWAEARGYMAQKPGGEALLFPTCYVQHNEPQIGRDTLEVLERNQLDVRCTRGLVCCGMPAWEHGDLETLRDLARTNLDVLEPYVAAGANVVVVNPTCSMMIRREWPELLEGEDRERAQRLAEKVRDPSELLWSLRAEGRFDEDFASRPSGAVAYHAPCHLRAQRAGLRARDLLRKSLSTKPAVTLECCGHDGTFAMRTEGFEASQRIGARAFDSMAAAEASVWVTDCPLAALQFEQHAGVKPMHPMTLLARAYRGDPLECVAQQGAETPMGES